jgi:hypothetical protein
LRQTDAYARSDRWTEGSLSALFDESADSVDVDRTKSGRSDGSESGGVETPTTDGQSANSNTSGGIRPQRSNSIRLRQLPEDPASPGGERRKKR